MKFTLIVCAIMAVVSMSSFTEKESNKSNTAVVSKTNIYGSVMDEMTGESLVGVEVELEGSGLKTYTDFDGNFTFENVAIGNYMVRAKLISYSELNGKELKVELNANNSVDVKLKRLSSLKNTY